jgi:hypothetical protein
MVPVLLLSWGLAADPFPFAEAEAELSVAISEPELKAHVHRLAGPEFLGRRGDGAERAAEHIAAAFARLPLQRAFGNSHFQPIPWLLTTPPPGGKATIGRNVGAFLPGDDPRLAEEWIIVAAHYDHLGVKDGKQYPGADDNASGVAMLLEVAEAFALAPRKPRRSVFFVAFDLEEQDLKGSVHFATRPPRPFKALKAFLVADLIGRSLADVMDEFVYVIGSETSPALRQLVTDVQPEYGLKSARLGADLVGTRSDYGPFRDRRVPFLFFSTGTHRDYHKPTDLPARLDYAKLTKVSRYVERLARRLADADDAAEWRPITTPDLDEVTSVRDIFARVLERPAVVPLTDEQRRQCVAARDKLAAMADRKAVTPEERAWLVATARWALLNVF